MTDIQFKDLTDLLALLGLFVVVGVVWITALSKLK